MTRQVTNCDHCKREIPGRIKPIISHLFPWRGALAGSHFCKRLCLFNWLEEDRAKWTKSGMNGNDNDNTKQWISL